MIRLCGMTLSIPDFYKLSKTVKLTKKGAGHALVLKCAGQTISAVVLKCAGHTVFAVVVSVLDIQFVLLLLSVLDIECVLLLLSVLDIDLCCCC